MKIWIPENGVMGQKKVEEPLFRDFCCVVRQRSFTVSGDVYRKGEVSKIVQGIFTPKSVPPAHPAKFSPSKALSACSTWPNYIQSEEKDSPLWSKRDRQPSSGWLVCHSMRFSRTPVFECCLKTQTVECVCNHIACTVCMRMHTCLEHQASVTWKVSCGPFFQKRSSLARWSWGGWSWNPAFETDTWEKLFLSST